MSNITKDRIDYLDSTRGIAAIIVLIFHTNYFIFHNIFSQQEFQRIPYSVTNLLNIIFNGVNSVSFFFVLSGFVLSYTYFKNKIHIEGNIKTFYIKRIFRIYPLYIVVVSFAFFLNNKYSTTSIYNYFVELGIVGNNHDLIHPGWSMTVEIILSFFVPIFILIITRSFQWYIFLIGSLLLFTTIITPFIVHFAIGVALSYIFVNNIRILNLSKNVQYLLLIPFILIYSFYPIVYKHSSLVSIISKFSSLLGANIVAIYNWTSAIGSFYFLYFILNNQKIQKFLNSKLLVFMGKISYGIYLTHWLIIYYIINPYLSKYLVSENSIMKYSIILFSVLIGTLLLSTTLYYLVEKPCINLGKKVSACKFNEKDLK